ncbi:MAG: hypothetical protein ACRDGW_07075, partial [Actinomycetota bacterium]
MEIGALWPFGRRDASKAREAEPSAPQAPRTTEPRRDGGDPGAADELRARRAEIARMEERALRESESIKLRAA